MVKYIRGICTIVLWTVMMGTVAAQSSPARPRQAASKPGGANRNLRAFEFVYAGAVTELAPGASARIWLPIASNTPNQRVSPAAFSIPGDVTLSRDPKYGNRLAYFEGVADDKGEIAFSLRYRVARRAVRAGQGAPVRDEERKRFVGPNRFVPSQGVLTRLFPKRLPETTRGPLIRKIYDQVDSHMKYDKPPGGRWGRGDTLWACDSGFGNCTDFHSLFISSCREMRVPARFVIGFPLSSKVTRGEIGGYHCWAECEIDEKWFSVDISEADKAPAKKEFYFGNLDPDRVAFSIGRDIELEPPNDSGPVNYLIYPHVEVNGKPHRAFRKAFAFRDLD